MFNMQGSLPFSHEMDRFCPMRYAQELQAKRRRTDPSAFTSVFLFNAAHARSENIAQQSKSDTSTAPGRTALLQAFMQAQVISDFLQINENSNFKCKGSDTLLLVLKRSKNINLKKPTKQYEKQKQMMAKALWDTPANSLPRG